MYTLHALTYKERFQVFRHLLPLPVPAGCVSDRSSIVGVSCVPPSSVERSKHSRSASVGFVDVMLIVQGFLSASCQSRGSWRSED